MAEPIDPARFDTNWRSFADPERSVAQAAAAMTAYIVGQRRPFLSELEALVEPLWDGPGGDAQLAYDAICACEPALISAERELDAAARFRHRGRLWVLRARAAYHLPDPRQGLVESFAMLRWLEREAGGQAVLLETLARPTPNISAELAVAALGIYPAALRRAQLSAEAQTHYFDYGLVLVLAYLRLSQGGPAALYERTHALASQWFYATVGRLVDERPVRALYQLDRQTRPPDARGEATAALRDLEYARRFGDELTVERLRRVASTQLGPLDRHRLAVDRHRYLAA